MIGSDDREIVDDDPLLDALPEKQRSALIALLGNPTVAAAARSAEISEPTLFRLLREPTFRRVYSDARRSVTLSAWRGLQTSVAGAVAVLDEIMRDTEAPPSSRIAAARTILHAAIRHADLLDIHERLERIEHGLDRDGKLDHDTETVS